MRFEANHNIMATVCQTFDDGVMDVRVADIGDKLSVSHGIFPALV